MTITVLDAWAQYQHNVLTVKPIRNRRTDEGRWKNHIAPVMDKLPLSSVKNFQIVSLRKQLEDKELSPQTVKHCMALTKRVMRKALEWELFQGPVPIFRMPSFDNRRIRFLSKNEAKELLNGLYKVSVLWHDISAFALYTGLRAGEILKLTTSDVNFDTAFVHVVDSKTGKNRSVPLNRISYLILKKYANRNPSDIMFKSEDEGLANTTQKVFANVVKKCGFNNGIAGRRHRVVFHTLRHTFASWLVQDGTSIAEVSTLLGHSDIKMTMRYAHLAPNQTRTTINRLLLT